MEHVPDVAFVYNESYDQTNTSKSLLKALKNTTKGGVLWLNGDVVFDPQLLDLMKPFIAAGQSVVAVNDSRVADEEIKYTTDARGNIDKLSKTVSVDVAEGEAVGINYVSKKNKKKLIKRLERVSEHDYFERAMENTIMLDNVTYFPVDTSRYLAIEIDSPDDLVRANNALRKHPY